MLAIAGGAGIAWKTGLFGRSGVAPVTRARRLMGTGVHLTVLGADQAASTAAAEATLARMAELEALLSRYRKGSEVARLNASGSIDSASDELLELLRLAERFSRLGDGAFDVTVQPLLELYRDGAGRPTPGQVERVLERVDHRGLRVDGRSVRLDRPEMQVTLDGIGKGYVVDHGVAVLKERGFDDVFVEAGGDLVASGRRGPGERWRIGIRRPRPGRSLQARFEATNRAVATSGDYMQPFQADYSQHHILDPRSGYSAPELASSTVIAPNAATADALATMTMVLGPRRGRELIEALPDCEAYFVSKDLEVTRTTGFDLA
jgi:thiamine biosynthesis lipoprotein